MLERVILYADDVTIMVGSPRWLLPAQNLIDSHYRRGGGDRTASSYKFGFLFQFLSVFCILIYIVYNFAALVVVSDKGHSPPGSYPDLVLDGSFPGHFRSFLSLFIFVLRLDDSFLVFCELLLSHAKNCGLHFVEIFAIMFLNFVHHSHSVW